MTDIRLYSKAGGDEPPDASMRMTLSDMRLQTLKERMPQPENLGDVPRGQET